MGKPYCTKTRKKQVQFQFRSRVNLSDCALQQYQSVMGERKGLNSSVPTVSGNLCIDIVFAQGTPGANVQCTTVKIESELDGRFDDKNVVSAPHVESRAPCHRCDGDWLTASELDLGVDIIFIADPKADGERRC